MSAAPAANGRRIGDILLELGFASEEALAKATTEHEKTGQPLGQILVDHGVITRLELASALAEQWSDQSASITLLPIPHPASAPRRAREPHDDDQYAARLQDAVADLAQRVGASAAQPTEQFDDRVTDLAERVEATVARTQRIEATLATLAESFEGVTGGVEDAFGVLQSGMAGLALDLARIDTSVAELAAQSAEPPATNPTVTARLEELGAAVATLAERPVTDPAYEARLDSLTTLVETLAETAQTPDAALMARIDEIAAVAAALSDRPVGDLAIENQLAALVARVENFVSHDEVAALRGSLVEVEHHLSVLADDAGATTAFDEQARLLTELRATVGELESRPVGDDGLGDRLTRIETELAERHAAESDGGEIKALSAQFERRANEHESLAAAVEQFGARLAAMDNDLAALAQSVTPADRIEQIAHRIEQIAHRIDDMAADSDAQELLAARLEAIESKLADEVVTGDDLSHALAAARAELTPALVSTVEPAVRGQIEDLAARIEQLGGGQQGEALLAARLDDLERRLPVAIVTPDELASALAGAREELASFSSVVEGPGLEALSADLESVRRELADMQGAPAVAGDTSDVRAELDALALRIEQLSAAESHDDEALVAKIEVIEQRLEASASPDPDTRIEQLVSDVDALRDQLARAERTPITDPVVASELETLSERLRVMDARFSSDIATTSEVTRLVEALRVELASAGVPILSDTADLEGTIQALLARVDGLTESIAAETPGAVSLADADLRRLDERVAAQISERIAELSLDVEHRLATAEAQPREGVPVAVDSSDLEDLLERNRMAIERVGLHLGEHDRALAELMRSRNLGSKLDELAARVDEIAGGAPSGGQQASRRHSDADGFSAGDPGTGDVSMLMRRVEDAEVASQADREKLMNRLERMASSIDWRLQRLEAGDTATPSSEQV